MATALMVVVPPAPTTGEAERQLPSSGTSSGHPTYSETPRHCEDPTSILKQQRGREPRPPGCLPGLLGDQ